VIADLKPYADYKDSGVSWLGKVPAHWEVVRSKRLFAARKDLARPDDVQLSATQAYGVIAQSLYEERTGYRVVKISMHLDKRRHVERDDFIISMRSFQGGLERAWSTGAIRSSYVVLKPDDQVDAAYFRYLFKSVPYIAALRATGDFIRDGQDLNYSNFCGVDLPLIPRAEQVAIGRFLDWSNGQLEQTIRAKRKTIALLTEQKRAVVQRAVTRGIDPTIRFKPSGIPWLGDIPSHWTTVRLKHSISRIEQGWSPQCDAQPAGDDEWGVLKVGCVNKDMFRGNQNKKLPATLKPDTSLEVVDGDILVSRANTTELLGLAALVERPRKKLILCDKLFRFRALADCFDPKYLVLLLRSGPSRAQIESSTSGASSSMQNIGQGVLKNLWVAVPPVSEQLEIVLRIDSNIQPLTAAIGRLEREIDLLREYRTRLVADVVTGKLNVCEAAALLPEEAQPVIAEEPLDETDKAELTDEETEA
jgi:type I restriction enzyme S subunit